MSIGSTINSKLGRFFRHQLSRSFANMRSSIVLLILVVGACEAKVFPFIHEEFESCVKPEDDGGYFDFSNFLLVATSDTAIFANGSIEFTREVKSPWKSVFFSEKYDKGSWYQTGPTKRIEDFCHSIQSPFEVWYPVTSTFNPKNCPFPAGVSHRF